jgi:DNA-binding CsgD family transcriptional regulator/tetratricopeptide (TPR) repeat protein
MPEPNLLARGAELLAQGSWREAKETFEAALRAGESAEALSGLGQAVFWLGDFAEAVELRQRAYAAFREHGDHASAARMALWLAAEYAASLGNEAVANGWLRRAERLIEELGPSEERGWLLLRQSRRSSDPMLAEQLARAALEVAKERGRRDLEVAAISQRGRALLAGGRTEEGFACLDEAMAAATSGELRSPEIVTDTCCDMIVACERAMEIERATEWCQVTDAYARRYNFQPLFAFCRVTYAGVLTAVGRWTEAENELVLALRAYRASLASKSSLAVAKLAELRLLQGKEAEAEELLAEHVQNPAVARVAAMLHLSRGDAPAAVRVLEKRLAAVEGDLFLEAPLLSLLVEARLAAGEQAGAADAARRLEDIAQTSKCMAFVASAAFASALVGCATQAAPAREGFESAVHAFVSAGMPLHAARARLALARCLADVDARAAKEECRRAVLAFEDLGARRDLDGAAELRRRLGVAARTGPRSTLKLTKREEEVLSLVGLGLSNAKIGARLFISPKTVEHHVGHILEKLGVETRAAAAAYAAKRPGQKPGGK